MKIKMPFIFIKRAVLFLPLALLTSDFSLLFAQGTAFTYQGRLNDSGSPAAGIYDLRFTIYDSASAGSVVAGPSTNTATGVTNGLFTVTLDFGSGPFGSGAPRWLEIGVRTNATGAFSTLQPRQPITPAPYSIFAENVGSGGLAAGTYANAVTLNNAANNFSGSFNGNGAGLTNVNAATLGGLSSSNFWKLGGNTGANPTNGNFIGTVDNLPFELKVNNTRAQRFEPNTNGAPNMIGGSPNNSVAAGVIGATISGGGAVNQNGSAWTNKATGNFGTVGGGVQNSVGFAGVIAGGSSNTVIALHGAIGGGEGNAIQLYSDHSTIGGGQNNVIFTGNPFATIGGGQYNTNDGYGATLAGGQYNAAIGAGATIGGGYGNMASGDDSTVGGGFYNNASGYQAMIPGGWDNTAAGARSFAAGMGANANHDGTFVWADSTGGFISTAVNQFLIRASGGVGIGLNNPSGALHVASSNSSPQLQITQQKSSDYTRLRMNVNDWPGSPFWEMDVSPGASPQLQFWNSTLRMYIDYSGNVTATSFNPTSDRNAKENFERINSRDVLDKVAGLPLTRWNFKQDPTTKHLGPMAQDFYAAFNVGPDDKHIATVDADGVALAAIQGLNRKVDDGKQQLEDKIQKLELENAKLKRRLEALEQVLHRDRTGLDPNNP